MMWGSKFGGFAGGKGKIGRVDAMQEMNGCPVYRIASLLTVLVDPLIEC